MCRAWYRETCPPFIDVCGAGRASLAAFLLEAHLPLALRNMDADTKRSMVNQSAADGSTPLERAMGSAHWDVVSLLLDHGAAHGVAQGARGSEWGEWGGWRDGA